MSWNVPGIDVLNAKDGEVHMQFAPEPIVNIENSKAAFQLIFCYWQT